MGLETEEALHPSCFPASSSNLIRNLSALFFWAVLWRAIWFLCALSPYSLTHLYHCHHIQPSWVKMEKNMKYMKNIYEKNMKNINLVQKQELGN